MSTAVVMDSFAITLVEPVEACVITRNTPLTPLIRARLSQCLGWQDETIRPVCHGEYTPLTVEALSDPSAIEIKADRVSFYAEGRSRLSGHVQVRETERIVNAKTAYVIREHNKVTKIELLDEVRYLESGRLMIARKASLDPNDKSGEVQDVLYRLNMKDIPGVLPAWGRASLIQRFANQDIRLREATYSTCPPKQESWRIEADEINLDQAHATGTAKNALLRLGEWPVFYAPYLSFPTSNERKSGFLIPLVGYSNVGGFTTSLPYYWNLAPNYDVTLTPSVYTERGVMMGGDFRYLTGSSKGTLRGQILPQDRAFGQFLSNNKAQFPELSHESTDRWSWLYRDNTVLAPNLTMNVDYQRVSDNYYLQDFSTNLPTLTQNQLLRQGDVAYTTDHWLLRGLLQSYQTLHPVNAAPIADVYERLPQLLAQGAYYDLPMGATLNVLGQFDYFHWPSNEFATPQGPRSHFNPVLSLPQLKPWGYITPSVEGVENYYDVHYEYQGMSQSFNRVLPRYSVDSGLTFERDLGAYQQTLEPRLFYLNVPYRNQTPVPVYDSGYMIFNTDQLFRTNRFSGFDRIGDANQLAYALTTRWLSNGNGLERASVTVGQLHYFSNRRVDLCYRQYGACTDSPYMLGYLSPTASTSPIASHGVYRINRALSTTADYVWDPATHATNNGNFNFHYQPDDNRIVSLGYTYLVNGNLLPTANGGVNNSALHQATFAYASPITDRWSGLGVYSYNISKGYSMLGFLGMQYENCCWAVRLMGGRTFMSLNSTNLHPQYNNNGYVQVVLKGLGSIASSDPTSMINTYLPGLRNVF